MKIIEKHANGLTLIELKSTAKPSSAALLQETDLAHWETFINTEFGGAPKHAVFYLDYGIRFAKWENGKLQFHEPEAPAAKYLQLARIFNEDRELKIWRVGERFHYRLRRDEEGEVQFAIDAEQNLWGTQADRQGNGKELPADWSRLWEERGTELIVPFPIAEAELPACIKTRNYIDEMANGQATYVDCRFVEIGKR
jgi:CRISPR-associated protein (TIGR03984 family)